MADIELTLMTSSNQCWTEERGIIQKEQIIRWHGWFILKLAWGCRTNTSVSLHSGQLSADANILKMVKYHIGLAHILVYHWWKNREKCHSYWTDGKCFEQNGSSQHVNLFSVCNSRLNSMQSKSVRASAGIQCARDIPLVSDRGLRRADSVTSPLHLGPARLMFSDLCCPQQTLDYCYCVLRVTAQKSSTQKPVWHQNL